MEFANTVSKHILSQIKSTPLVQILLHSFLCIIPSCNPTVLSELSIWLVPLTSSVERLNLCTLCSMLIEKLPSILLQWCPKENDFEAGSGELVSKPAQLIIVASPFSLCDAWTQHVLPVSRTPGLVGEMGVSCPGQPHPLIPLGSDTEVNYILEGQDNRVFWLNDSLLGPFEGLPREVYIMNIGVDEFRSVKPCKFFYSPMPTVHE